MFKNASNRFPFQTPQNKEEYFYRSIFESHFPSHEFLILFTISIFKSLKFGLIATR